MKGVEDQVKVIVSKTFQLGLDEIDYTLSIDTCGNWDSLSHLQLILALESNFGITIEPVHIQELTNYPTILEIITKEYIGE